MPQRISAVIVCAVGRRPLNPDGTWQYKTEKEYLCFRNNEECGFTAAEFKESQADGWEKQYPYKVGRKKERINQAQKPEKKKQKDRGWER